MVVVGGIGLLVNVVALLLLRGGATESLNVKGAYLEVVADTAGSIGVVAAAGLISWTGQTIWDVVVALAIGVFVAIRAVMLGRQVLHVLSQNVPAGVEATDTVAVDRGYRRRHRRARPAPVDADLRDERGDRAPRHVRHDTTHAVLDRARQT